MPMQPHFYTATYQQTANPLQFQQQTANSQQFQQQPTNSGSTPHQLAMAQDILQSAQRNYTAIKKEMTKPTKL